MNLQYVCRLIVNQSRVSVFETFQILKQKYYNIPLPKHLSKLNGLLEKRWIEDRDQAFYRSNSQGMKQRAMNNFHRYMLNRRSFEISRQKVACKIIYSHKVKQLWSLQRWRQVCTLIRDHKLGHVMNKLAYKMTNNLMISWLTIRR